ncbi:MAG: archease [Candidatus Thorarchaeota archaeon]|nr:archease [Candidatus Thorarchaeota archaeon]
MPFKLRVVVSERQRMTPRQGFEFHEHTADITIECWASSLKEAFEQAALATFEVILNTDTVRPIESVNVSVQGIDIQELLVEWIGHLIALIDINTQFYSMFEVLELDEKDEGCSLKGRVWGEEIDLDRHETRTEVKAMTYADMRIDQRPESTTLWFTLDL